MIFTPPVSACCASASRPPICPAPVPPPPAAREAWSASRRSNRFTSSVNAAAKPGSSSLASAIASAARRSSRSVSSEWSRNAQARAGCPSVVRVKARGKGTYPVPRRRRMSAARLRNRLLLSGGFWRNRAASAIRAPGPISPCETLERLCNSPYNVHNNPLSSKVRPRTRNLCRHRREMGGMSLSHIRGRAMLPEPTASLSPE